jgi:DNA topoisomerase-2
MLAELNAEHLKIQNRVRFIKEIISGKLVVQKRKKIELLVELKEKKYDPIFKKNANGTAITEGEDDEETSTSGFDHGYDYLLSMPIWSLTMEKVPYFLSLD